MQQGTAQDSGQGAQGNPNPAQPNPGQGAPQPPAPQPAAPQPRMPIPAADAPTPQPPASQPAAPQPGTPLPTAGAPTGDASAPEPEDKTPANYQLGKYLPPVLSVKIPTHTLQFNEAHFLRLLAGSISLTKDEKKRIVESVPKLRQSQVDELIRIFEEECEKFAQLSLKHIPQLEKLAKQHYQEWMDIETEFQAAGKKEEDASKADEIRKQLGL